MNVKILKGNISYTITLEEEIALKALKTLNVGDCIVVSGYFKNRHRRKYIDRNNNYHDKFIVNDIIYTSNQINITIYNFYYLAFFKSMHEQ